MKSIPTRFRVLSSGAAALVASLVFQSAPTQAGVFDYISGPYTENFDLLGTGGLTTSTLTSWTTDLTSPWSVFVTGNGAGGFGGTEAYVTSQAIHSVSNGSIAVVNNIPAGPKIFNNGATNAPDRALGTGNTGGDPVIDLAGRNMSGRSLDGFQIVFDTEWWRGGSSAAAADFGYTLLFSTTGEAGTWVAAGSPTVSINPAATAVLDGNLAANRAVSTVNFTLPAALANGGTFFFRWRDTNDPTDGPDANIALDNVTLTGFANLVYNSFHTVGGAPNGVLGVGAGDYFLSGGAPVGFQNGDVVTFSDNVTATIDVPAAISPIQVNFTNQAETYTLTGAGGITGALNKVGSGDLVLANTNSFTSTSLNGGKLTITANNALATAGALTIGDVGVTIETIGNATVQNGLNNVGLLTKTGAGTLTFTGALAGTGTGGINLQEGTIQLGTSASSGAATQVTNISNNATLEWIANGDSNPGAKVFNILTGGATLSSTLAAQGNAVIFNTANTIVGSEPLNKAGIGVLRFTAVQGMLSSPWTVNNGTIETTLAGGFGTGNITVNGGGLVVLNGSTALTLTNNIVLNGGAIGIRSGNLATYGTPTTTIEVTADSALSVRSNSTQANGQTYVVGALLSGSGALTITGPATSANAGTAILANAANTYSGNFIVNARQNLTVAAVGGTGKTLGTATVTLRGGILNVLDNGTGDNGTINYGNNVVIEAPSDVLFPSASTINLNRQSGANSGNTVRFGNLTIGADAVTLASNSAYSVSFTGGTLTGSATLNTGTMNVTIGGIGGDAFDFTRNGSGTLNLTGTNTFTGTLHSSAGTVNVSGSLAGGINVANTNLNITAPVAGSVTATDSVLRVASTIAGGLAISGPASSLAGAGTISGAVNIGNGVTINPGDAAHRGALKTGDLTFGASVGDTSTINFNVDPVAANRGYIESGTLSVFNGATVTLQLLNALPAVGFYPIIDYSGAAIDLATFNAFTLAPIANPRITAVLNHNTGSGIIELNVQSVDAPRWTGAGDDVWTTAIQTPKNWALQVAVGTTDFITGDEVLFDNSATGKIVNLTAQDVAPSRVTFNNSTGNDYTLNGTFAITGAGSLDKTGTGAVTINNTNSFTGAVNANGCTINFATIADSGANSALGAGTALNFGGGTLNYTGPAASTNRTVSVGTGGGTFSQNGTGDLTLAGDITGAGTLSKTGPGKLILTGTASTVAGINIIAGALQIGDGLAAAGSPGSGPIANAASLILNPGADLIVTNTISGAGTLTKDGFGNATLGGVLPNTYTGLTTVNGGTLFGGKPNVNAIGGDLLVNTGGTFRYAGDNTRNQVADTATVTLDGGTFGDPLNVNPVAGVTDTIASLVIQNGGAFASGRNSALTPFTITGTTTLTNGSLLAQRAGGITTNALLIEATGAARMDGGGTVAGEESRINVGAGGLTLHDAQVQFNAGPSTITAASVGSILTLNGDLTSTGTSSFSRTVGDLALKGEVNLGGGTRTFNIAGDLTIGAVGLPIIISNGGITKTGTGILRYTGAGTYAGGTTVNEGQLILVNGVPGTGTLTLNSASPMIADITADTILTNTIEGSGGIEKVGGAILRLQGAASNTFTGLTHIQAGTIISQKGAGIISIGGDLLIDAGATFRFSSNIPQNQIADTSHVTVAGMFGTPADATAGERDIIEALDVKSTGTFVSGRNMTTVGVRNPFTVTETATVEAGGTLLASRGGGFAATKLVASGFLNMDGGATGGQESFIQAGTGGLELNNAVVQFNTGTSAAIAANSKGSVLALIGDLTSTGNSSMVNLTTFTSVLANVELVGDRTFHVSDTLTVGTTTAQVNLVNDVLGNVGGLIKTGPGTLELNGNNTFTGVTDIREGIVTLAGSLSGSSNISVRAGAFLDTSASVTGLNVGVAQILSGSGDVIGAVQLEGTVAPGAPGGVNDLGNLKVTGAFTFGFGATAAFELNKTGNTLTSDLLTLSVGNTMTYNGTLRVTYNGALAENDTFNLFDADTFAGEFTAYDLQNLPAGLYWDTSDLTVDGTITIVPEPTSAALFLGGLSLLAYRRRRQS